MEMYVTFELETTKCPSCGKQMMGKARRGIFPLYVGKNQEAQMKERGVVFSSDAMIDGDYICIECKEAGKASITCALCGEKKPSNKVGDSFGAPPEYLCTDCYDSVPAKQWDEKVDKLREVHRWDWD